jgi:hypothetical protein
MLHVNHARSVCLKTGDTSSSFQVEGIRVTKALWLAFYNVLFQILKRDLKVSSHCSKPAVTLNSRNSRVPQTNHLMMTSLLNLRQEQSSHGDQMSPRTIRTSLDLLAGPRTEIMIKQVTLPPGLLNCALLS